jgi:AcrR family transcriptional regulator
MAVKRRLSRERRREQIIEVTLDSIAENGVRGTTLSRIAMDVGVTTPALYAHFENRKEILLAALDALFEHRTLPHRNPTKETGIERLREIGYRHTQLMESADDQSVFALFEFIAAPPEEGLRETLGEKHVLLARNIANIVREGQEDGTIRPDVDPVQTAWMMMGRAWTEDITHLLGVDEFDSERSNRMLDLILDSISVQPRREG